MLYGTRSLLRSDYVINSRGAYEDYALECQEGSAYMTPAAMGLRIGASTFFFIYGMYLWTRFPNPKVEDERLKRFALCSSLNAWIMLFTGLFNLLQMSQVDDFYLDNCFKVDAAKYAQWSITCPMLTLQIAILAKAEVQRHVELVLSTFFMLVIGLGASIAPELEIRLILWVCSTFFFILMWWAINKIVMEATGDRENLCRGSSYIRKTSLFVLVSWTLFPILWIIGPEGGNLITAEVATGGIAVIDFASKGAFSLFIFWVRLKWGGQMLRGELEEWQQADEATRIATLIKHINTGDAGFFSHLEPDQIESLVKNPEAFQNIMQQIEQKAASGELEEKQDPETLRKKKRTQTAVLMNMLHGSQQNFQQQPRGPALGGNQWDVEKQTYPPHGAPGPMGSPMKMTSNVTMQSMPNHGAPMGSMGSMGGQYYDSSPMKAPSVSMQQMTPRAEPYQQPFTHQASTLSASPFQQQQQMQMPQQQQQQVQPDQMAQIMQLQQQIAAMQQQQQSAQPSNPHTPRSHVSVGGQVDRMFQQMDDQQF
uniref:Uncharacterized protein n=1 Tax=Chromera velia CCMP2878 TaxID=1169474 RepID=A0A0G4GU07_9ALVE|eukprot:Cvel_747.t1-p1 / transcript=Cvel_747.t1 / gene=Cvel_747 / organism=Chromera_velia_CCMP2878 / gene_product=Archaerhodopsin-2, putative / transcript_product=Archaerhodopsin-2, putative / location=Cvel_scaffold23:64920-68715(-) / protein_length=537 / sequence_SO=supercontig / SO=protein_coding / is_pseudo=false